MYCDICGERKPFTRSFCGDVVCADCFEESVGGDFFDDKHVYHPDTRRKVHKEVKKHAHTSRKGTSPFAEGSADSTPKAQA